MTRSTTPIIIFSLLALLPLIPTLHGPYIFTLDSSVSPTSFHGVKSMEDFIYGSWLTRPNQGDLTIDASQIPLYIISVWLLKIFPSLLLQRAELFLFLLIAMIGMHQAIRTTHPGPRYFAAILYAFNPFTYQRIIAGHWLIMWGYAILPFLFSALMEKEKDWKKITLLLTLIAALSTHVLAVGFILLFWLMQKKDIRSYAKILIFFCLINSWWLIPVATAQTTKISMIDHNHITAFATDGRNPILSVFLLQGFWREQAYTLHPQWIVIPAVLSILVLIGYGYHRRHLRLYLLGAAAALLAVGTAYPLTERLFLLLFEIPVMKGFREPQKFVMILCLLYSYLGAASIRKRQSWAALILPALLIPAFAMIPLATADYPSGWHDINSYFRMNPGDYTVLSLPWHLYLDYDWVEGRIANPSQIFFDAPVIRADNIETGPVTTSSTDPVSLYVEASEGIESLALLNVRYIIATHDAQVEGARAIITTPDATLYEAPYLTSLFLESDDLQEFTPLAYTKHSPVSYTIDPTKRYVILTKGYNPRFRLDGEKPVPGYPVNLWENQGTSLRFVTWQFWWYGISLFSLALLIFLRQDKAASG